VVLVNYWIVDENLLMVPAQHEFRQENFSQVTLDCVISVTPGESKNRRWTRARDQAVRNLLKTHGLTSAASENLTTIVSYEGVVQSPVQIVPVPSLNPDMPPGARASEDADASEDSTAGTGTGAGVFYFTARAYFAPLSFPDQWKALENRAVIQQKLDEFFQLFR
jgi:hypothetical protein